MPYWEKSRRLREYLTPEAKENISAKGQEFVCMALILGCQWGYGDAYAGHLLGRMPEKNVDAVFELARRLGYQGRYPRNQGGDAIMVMLEELGTTFLGEEVGKKLAANALSG